VVGVVVTMGSRERHPLDQVIAFNLEVQAKLRSFERDLRGMGYGHNEAWAIARALQDRILGPVLDNATRALPAAATVDEIIRQRLEELNG
jgi:hypothetical protein